MKIGASTHALRNTSERVYYITKHVAFNIGTVSTCREFGPVTQSVGSV